MRDWTSSFTLLNIRDWSSSIALLNIRDWASSFALLNRDWASSFALLNREWASSIALDFYFFFFLHTLKNAPYIQHTSVDIVQSYMLLLWIGHR